MGPGSTAPKPFKGALLSLLPGASRWRATRSCPARGPHGGRGQAEVSLDAFSGLHHLLLHPYPQNTMAWPGPSAQGRSSWRKSWARGRGRGPGPLRCSLHPTPPSPVPPTFYNIFSQKNVWNDGLPHEPLACNDHEVPTRGLRSPDQHTVTQPVSQVVRGACSRPRSPTLQRAPLEGGGGGRCAPDILVWARGLRQDGLSWQPLRFRRDPGELGHLRLACPTASKGQSTFFGAWGCSRRLIFSKCFLHSN